MCVGEFINESQASLVSFSSPSCRCFPSSLLPALPTSLPYVAIVALSAPPTIIGLALASNPTKSQTFSGNKTNNQFPTSFMKKIMNIS